MGIPKNITKEHLLKAISKIDNDGIPKDGDSQYFDVIYNGKKYPPKLIVSYANIFANGSILNRNLFDGGIDTPCFKLLEENGFQIEEKSKQLNIQSRVWVEKTIVDGRSDRIQGERALGKALWSPQKGKPNSRTGTSADIYKNMRLVNSGDFILHFIDDKKFSGISIVKNKFIETNGLPGTAWADNAYLIELTNYTELIPPINREDILTEKNRKVLDDIAKDSEVFYNEDLNLRQGAYLTPCPTQLLKVINEAYKAKSSKNLPLINDSDIQLQNKDQKDILNNMDTPEMYNRFLLSIKTKPFIILAGFSGTGKSRLSRTLAYKFNNIESDRANFKHPPSNFQLIKVKPNWHDSSELLGYESRISGKDRFIVTDFIRFLVRAWQFPDTPFFLCLDEMNLAPVEQYFAEYLSSIEARRLTSSNKIKTDPLISSTLISKYANKNNGVDTHYELWQELELLNLELQEELKSNGLGIPQNLIVMGTVNMDETTHSFSRKVLDRAMTIEMNDFDLSEGLADAGNDWMYSEFPIDKTFVVSEKTQGSEVYKELGQTGNQIIDYLNLINDKLENSPFKIAYRVRDEFLLFAYNYSLLNNKPSNWVSDAIDEMTLMKILPRVEGDEDKTKFLDDLITVFQNNNLPKSLKKLSEMIERRRLFHYTSFWS
jgi:5-methylcytosine-specific restriction protein B